MGLKVFFRVLGLGGSFTLRPNSLKCSRALATESSGLKDASREATPQGAFFAETPELVSAFSGSVAVTALVDASEILPGMQHQVIHKPYEAL